jgi:hypothetical protein
MFGREGEVRFSQLSAEDVERHPLARAVARALRSEQDWDNLVRLADEWQAQPLTRWLELNADLRTQAGHDGPRRPCSRPGAAAARRRRRRAAPTRLNPLPPVRCRGGDGEPDL